MTEKMKDAESLANSHDENAPGDPSGDHRGIKTGSKVRPLIADVPPAHPSNMAIDEHGRSLPYSPTQVEQIVLKALAEGEILAGVIKMKDGSLAVQCMGEPSEELAHALDAAARGYRLSLDADRKGRGGISLRVRPIADRLSRQITHELQQHVACAKDSGEIDPLAGEHEAAMRSSRIIGFHRGLHWVLELIATEKEREQ